MTESEMELPNESTVDNVVNVRPSTQTEERNSGGDLERERTEFEENYRSVMKNYVADSLRAGRSYKKIRKKVGLSEQEVRSLGFDYNELKSLGMSDRDIRKFRLVEETRERVSGLEQVAAGEKIEEVKSEIPQIETATENEGVTAHTETSVDEHSRTQNVYSGGAEKYFKLKAELAAKYPDWGTEYIQGAAFAILIRDVKPMGWIEDETAIQRDARKIRTGVEMFKRKVICFSARILYRPRIMRADELSNYLMKFGAVASIQDAYKILEDMGPCIRAASRVYMSKIKNAQNNIRYVMYWD